MNRRIAPLRERLANTAGMAFAVVLGILCVWAGGMAGLWAWHEIVKFASRTR